MKPSYKFAIDGLGIIFRDIYRNQMETGIAYQRRAMLGFWRSVSKSGYILVYERTDSGEFPRFPVKVIEVRQSGEEAEIDVEEWKKRRLYNK